MFRTSWIIHRLFWLLSNFWELILQSLNLPSLLICFLSISCSLMLCRHVLTLLFYFIVRIFLFCVCLYMYVCIYTSWIIYIYIYYVHLISYQTELCLYRVVLAVFAVCRTIFTKVLFRGFFFTLYKLLPLLPLLKRIRIWHISVKRKIRTKLKVHAWFPGFFKCTKTENLKTINRI